MFNAEAIFKDSKMPVKVFSGHSCLGLKHRKCGFLLLENQEDFPSYWAIDCPEISNMELPCLLKNPPIVLESLSDKTLKNDSLYRVLTVLGHLWILLQSKVSIPRSPDSNSSMILSIWDKGKPRKEGLSELKTAFSSSCWIDVIDPTADDLKNLAEKLDIPSNMLVGKMRSNYPHVDSYPEYTKIFCWYTSPQESGESVLFDISPVEILTNGVSVLTISQSKTGVQDAVQEALTSQTYASISVAGRVIYLTMIHLLQGYERFVEYLERYADKVESMIPPWPRQFYTEVFNIRKEGSHLLRLTRHFKILAEALEKGNVHIQFTDDEKRLLDIVYERAVSAEETTETTLEDIRDLISLHLDTMSHDMNRAMRLIAMVTAIVAVPSVISSMLGMNLIDVPWHVELWQVALASISTASLLAIYFYRKGWLRDR